MENVVRKGEIACNKQFFLFSQCFLPYMVLFFYFKCTLKCCLRFVSIMKDQSKLLSSGNKLMYVISGSVQCFREMSSVPFLARACFVKRGLNALLKVSNQVSLRSSHRLTWTKTLRNRTPKYDNRKESIREKKYWKKKNQFSLGKKVSGKISISFYQSFIVLHK